eukprot:CAMPEP_0196580604 /NCGR_PEP_ID=MMETSP1081-20130531/29573_1 /TAXON_ID=36882 /ORGANISM="Pyramimonas amylifera, Strain CCMP720" /LENGTH=240 /DNA_ID=CAMNT_0041900517 /DNA_START=84 /DNA_END=806 /DNA_ORIENTATION=-
MMGKITIPRHSCSSAPCLRGSAITNNRIQSKPVRRSFTVYAAQPLPAQYKGVKPVADRVFVKVAEAEQQSAGGILLPSLDSQNKPTQGVVVAVGPGKKGEKGMIPVSLKVGDTVSYSKFAGTEVAIGEDPHILLKEEDCIGLMSGDVSKMSPLSDRVLIQCSEEEDETDGGLLLTGSSTEKPLTGKVVAVGPGKAESEEEMDVTVGSEVMYSKYSGTEMTGDDGTEYIVVRVADVLATLS